MNSGFRKIWQTVQIFPQDFQKDLNQMIYVVVFMIFQKHLHINSKDLLHSKNVVKTNVEKIILYKKHFVNLKMINFFVYMLCNLKLKYFIHSKSFIINKKQIDWYKYFKKNWRKWYFLLITSFYFYSRKMREYLT